MWTLRVVGWCTKKSKGLRRKWLCSISMRRHCILLYEQRDVENTEGCTAEITCWKPITTARRLIYITSHHIISYHIISYHIISYIVSYHKISYHIIYHIISIISFITYHIISIISYHTIYHVITYIISYIISCHNIYIISHNMYHILYQIIYRILYYIKSSHNFTSYHIYHIISYHIIYITSYNISYSEKTCPNVTSSDTSITGTAPDTNTGLRQYCPRAAARQYDSSHVPLITYKMQFLFHMTQIISSTNGLYRTDCYLFLADTLWWTC